MLNQVSWIAPDEKKFRSYPESANYSLKTGFESSGPCKTCADDDGAAYMVLLKLSIPFLTTPTAKPRTLKPKPSKYLDYSSCCICLQFSKQLLLQYLPHLATSNGPCESGSTTPNTRASPEKDPGSFPTHAPLPHPC